MFDKKTILVIVLFIISVVQLKVSADDGNSSSSKKLHFYELDNFQVISLSGGYDNIYGEDEVEINSFVEKNINSKDIVVYVSYSKGGVLESFLFLMNRLQEKCTLLRKHSCYIITVIDGFCASSCTFLPLLSDYSVSTESAELIFHNGSKKYFFNFLSSPMKGTTMLNTYISYGADQKWFKANRDKLFNLSDVNIAYSMTKKEELDSNLIQEQVSSWTDYKYNQLLNLNMSEKEF